MTSKQSKNDRLKESQLSRAKAYEGMDTTDVNIDPPPGSVLADPSELGHNNTYSPFPRFYVDKIVVCRDCKKEEVWTAKNQKWWYEEAKGNINTKAVFCRTCRDKKRARKDEARKIHLEGIAEKMVNEINLSVSDKVIDFVKSNIESLALDNPVPILIFGKFSDEKEDHFRISLQEMNEFEKNNENSGSFIKATGIPDIFISSSFNNLVEGKNMVLVGDIVEFE